MSLAPRTPTNQTTTNQTNANNMVDKQTYIFTAFETVNPAICDKLATMSFDDFLTFWDLNELNNEGETENAITQYNIITQYCQEQQKANYNLERKYTYAANATKGRIFVDGIGLQRIYNQFRGCLCEEVYYDLDMVSAHHSILLYICRENEIATPILSQYVANRENYLAQLMQDENISRDEAKRLFIIALNKTKDTEKNYKRKIKNKFYLSFDKEIHEIQQKLIEKYPVEVKHLMTHNYKAKYNLNGCLTNILMTTIENEILQKTITYLKSKNIIPDVPMFDGVMFRMSSYFSPIDDLISQLNTLTRSYGVKWSHKPHNTELKTRILSLEKTNNLTFFGTSVIQIGKYLWDNIFASRIVSCNGLLYMKSFTDNLYISNEKIIKSVIHNYICAQNLYLITDSDGGTEPLTCKFRNVKDVVEHITILAMDASNNDPYFMGTLFSKSICKLNFKNGVYDFREMHFINDPTQIEGLFKINYDYTDTRDTALMEEIYDRIINPMFGIKNETDLEQLRIKTQLRDCILYSLARAVAGFYEDKKWFMLEGLRNSGKGVLFGLLDTTIGPYMTSCDSRNFLFKPSGSGNDIAKDNMFLFDMQLNRIINTQEFTITPGKKSFINGGIIKQICSGGDDIETRAHYGMPIKIKCQAALMFAANEYPDISPANCFEECIVWSMNGKFINTDAGEVPVAGYMNYPKDTSIKQFIKRPEVGLAFLHILINALGLTQEQRKYPDETRDELATANEQMDTQSSANVLNSVVRFTGSSADTVSNSDLATALQAKNIVLGKMLLSKQLKLMGAVPYKLRGGERGYSHISII
jgi:hypothetical protein